LLTSVLRWLCDEVKPLSGLPEDDKFNPAPRSVLPSYRGNIQILHQSPPKREILGCLKHRRRRDEVLATPRGCSRQNLFVASPHATTLNCPSLPYKGHEVLGALLVFWILLRKEFEHDLLLLIHAQSEHDGDEEEHADTEDTADERGAKCRKQDA